MPLRRPRVRGVRHVPVGAGRAVLRGAAAWRGERVGGGVAQRSAVHDDRHRDVRVLRAGARVAHRADHGSSERRHEADCGGPWLLARRRAAGVPLQVRRLGDGGERDDGERQRAAVRHSRLGVLDGVRSGGGGVSEFGELQHRRRAVHVPRGDGVELERRVGACAWRHSADAGWRRLRGRGRGHSVPLRQHERCGGLCELDAAAVQVADRGCDGLGHARAAGLRVAQQRRAAVRRACGGGRGVHLGRDAAADAGRLWPDGLDAGERAGHRADDGVCRRL